jgi:hypothetical protein
MHMHAIEYNSAQARNPFGQISRYALMSERYVLRSRFWGYCIEPNYPATWTHHMCATDAEARSCAHVFRTHRAAEKSASAWAKGLVQIIRLPEPP